MYALHVCVFPVRMYASLINISVRVCVCVCVHLTEIENDTIAVTA